MVAGYLRWFLMFCTVVGAVPLQAETAAEHAANVAAQRELDSSPRDGNIPSYSLPPDALKKSVHLESVRTTMHFAGLVWGIVSLLLLLGLGGVRWMQGVVAGYRNRWLQGFTFTGLFFLATTLLDLPLEMFGQWQRRMYGLSVQSWASWFGDQLKSFTLAWSFGGLMVMLLFLVIRKAPRRWWLIFWAVSIPIMLVGVFVEPYVIDPLFNHFEPLGKTNADLVKRLEEVVRRGHMEIPPERMFLMRASDKVTTMNAYVTGFGASKRVVVWDTSIAKGTTDQILFIFGHESGHYVLNHIVKGLLIGAAGLLVSFFLGYQFVQWALRRYGPGWGVTEQTQWGTLAVLMLSFSVFSAISEPLTMGLTRIQEHAADVYGQEAIHGIVADPQGAARGAFQVLGETSFDVPNPSQLVEWWTYSHPSIGRRAAFSAHYDPWAAGMQPKYFAER